MTPDQLLSALAALDVRVHEHDGWRARRHGALSAHVVMVHDSVTGSMSDERAAAFCAAGRRDLAGPLYECLVGRDGVAHLVAHGVTWHAGRGNAARLAQARRGQMPLDRELGRPGPDDTSGGNQISHGVALVTYGAGPYSPEQVEAGHRVVAAYCKAEGWRAADGAGSVIGHGEYSARKIDPELNMGVLRARVHALMVGSSESWHVVAAGETLWALARRHGTTVAEIKRLNDMASDLVKTGARLRVR